jgi:hypothetical protein
MSVYNYIAESNPYFAKGICHKYGYETTNVRSKADLGQCLKRLVANEGEPAFRDIMENHPDKDVIIEMFSNSKKADNFSNMDGNGNRGCGCSSCNNKPKDHYMYADGSSSNNTNSLTSVALIGASLLLAVAIITKNK